MNSKIVNLIKKYLPRSSYLRARKLGTQILQKFHPRLSEEEIRGILINKLGINKGSVVFIHSSVDKLFLNFPYYELLPILRDIVGPDGTLLFSCSHIIIRAEDYLSRPDAVFDVKRSVTVRGILPEMARMETDAYRSLHPTNSVVAIGRLAKELTMYHQDTIFPCGEKSPFFEITKHMGVIIGLGVGVDRLSFVHCVEDVMKDRFPIQTRLDKIFDCKVIDYDRKIRYIKTLVAKNIKYRNVEKYMRKYVSKDICHSFSYKRISFFRANARLLFEKMEELAKEGKTIYFQENEN